MMKNLCAAVLVLLFLSGCQTVAEKGEAGQQKPAEQAGEQKPPVPALQPPRSIAVFASDDANENLVTDLDIVFLYAPALVKAMPSNAPAWFDRKTRLRQRHAGNMDVASLQVVPGTAHAVRMPKRSSQAVEVIAYASYLGKQGIQRLRLTPYRDVAIYLNEKMIEAGNR